MTMFARGLLLAILALLASCGGGGGGTATFDIDATALSFEVGRNHIEPADQTLHVTVKSSKVAYVGVAYTDGETQPVWLSVVARAVGGNNYEVSFGIVTTDLTPGTYRTTPEVGTADANGNILDKVQVTITYTVDNALQVQSTSFYVHAVAGSQPARQPLTLTVGGDNLTYLLASDQPWLIAPAGPQHAPGDAMMTVDSSGLAAGRYSGQITVTNQTTPGDTFSLPVSLTVDANRILVSQYGVGLTKFLLGNDAPSHDVIIRNLNGRKDLGWTAVSGASWLIVTPSGTPDTPMTVSVSLLDLPSPGSYSETYVQISSTDGDTTNVEQIQVGLWYDLSRSGDVTVSLPAGTQPTGFAMSPTGPYVYVATGGSGIVGYNVYTGAQTLAAYVGVDPSGVAVSDDGKVIFYQQNGIVMYQPVTIFGGSSVRPFRGAPGYPMLTARTDGHALFFFGNGQANDAYAGTQLQLPAAAISAAPVADQGGAQVYVDHSGSHLYFTLNGAASTSLSLEFSEMDQFLISSPLQSQYGCAATTIRQMAVALDDQALALACGAESTFRKFDLATQTFTSLPAPQATATTAVATAAGGRIVGGADGTTPLLFVYEADGSISSTTPVGSAGDHMAGVGVSADQLRAVSLLESNAPKLVLSNLP